MFWVCRKIANALFWLSVTHIFSATSQNNDTTMNIGIKVYVFEMDKKHVSTRSRPTICGHIAEASWKTSRCLKHARVNPMKIGYVPSQKCLLTDQKYTPNVSLYSIHGSYVFFWCVFVNSTLNWESCAAQSSFHPSSKSTSQPCPVTFLCGIYRPGVQFQPISKKI